MTEEPTYSYIKGMGWQPVEHETQAREVVGYRIIVERRIPKPREKYYCVVPPADMVDALDALESQLLFALEFNRSPYDIGGRHYQEVLDDPEGFSMYVIFAIRIERA